jgi:hypothetical protein
LSLHDSRKPNFFVDLTSFSLLKDEVGVGKIVELSKSDAGLLAPHIEGHPHTVYVAASGVSLGGQYGVFSKGEQQIAVEWVRQETRPRSCEPECNAYRYLFGLTPGGRCVGYEVTEIRASSVTGQVADHWTTIDEVVKRYFIK